MEEDYIEKHIE